MNPFILHKTATSADDEGFAESRDHRAFAGCQRGGMMIICVVSESGLFFSLPHLQRKQDTDRTAFEDTIQTGDFAELPIHYLYVASGNFDFARPAQVQDYQVCSLHSTRLRSGAAKYLF